MVPAIVGSRGDRDRYELPRLVPDFDARRIDRSDRSTNKVFTGGTGLPQADRSHDEYPDNESHARGAYSRRKRG